ncbi:MAG: sulfite exporter TauE/SafE family protein [Armatimonadetes bacterium]|nr:sulfite exporter TauE/SafE family protein [Armatimonadota bacterium]
MLFVAIAVSALLIGLAKAGFAGFALLNVPVLTMVTDHPDFAVGVTLPMLLAGDVATGWRYYGLWDKRIVLTMVPGTFIGVLVSMPLMHYLGENKEIFTRSIGILALAFTGFQLFLESRRRELPENRPPAPVWQGVVAGVFTGICSNIAHQGGVVSNLWLLSQNQSKECFAATAFGVYFLLNSFKVWPYINAGWISPNSFYWSLAGMPFAVAGVLVGAKLLKKMDPKVFAPMILWMTIAAGLKLALWP